MIRRLSIASVATAAMAMSLSAMPSASAEERTCRGTLGVITVDDLRVPDGATCTLEGTTVKGTVSVQRRATLRAFDVRVVGNVQSENARRVVVRSSSVGGSIQHVQGGTAVVRANRVSGDVQMFANGGDIVIARNRIDGNLQCKSNTPAPTGGANVVGGNKEDQCARL
jgi:hypothetical protein